MMIPKSLPFPAWFFLLAASVLVLSVHLHTGRDSVLLLPVCASSLGSSSPGSLSSTSPSALDWVDTEQQGSARDTNCEVCQVLCEVVTLKVREKLPASHPLSPHAENHTSEEVPSFSSPGKTTRSSRSAKPSARELAARGSIDVLVSEVLNAEELCSFSSWKYYADQTEDIFVYTMTAACKLMVEEAEELLERLAPKLLSARELAQKVCMDEGTGYCEAHGLWTEGDTPSERLSKEERNQRQAWRFLNFTRTLPEVVETESGLQYRIITQGSNGETVDQAAERQGRDPPLCPDSLDALVEVHYRGALPNDKEFDSSYSRGEPAKFKLSQVVKGWGEGLQYMCEGERFEFFIPPLLGYGKSGAGADIGPFSALKFEVHLLKVEEGGLRREERDRKKQEENNKAQAESQKEEDRRVNSGEATKEEEEEDQDESASAADTKKQAEDEL